MMIAIFVWLTGKGLIDTRKENDNILIWNRPDNLISHSDDVLRAIYTLPDVPLPDIEETQYLVCKKTGDSNFNEYEGNISTPQQFTQAELNNLVRDLNLSKRASERLAFRLNEKNYLKSEAKITAFRLIETDTFSLFYRR